MPTRKSDKPKPARKPRYNDALGERLLASVRQMVVGEVARETIVPDVVLARQRIRMSQREFAEMLHISVRTLQGWEQGRREPTGPALTLIEIAKRNPDALRELAC